MAPRVTVLDFFLGVRILSADDSIAILFFFFYWLFVGNMDQPISSPQALTMSVCRNQGPGAELRVETSQPQCRMPSFLLGDIVCLGDGQEH